MWILGNFGAFGPKYGTKYGFHPLLSLITKPILKIDSNDSKTAAALEFAILDDQTLSLIDRIVELNKAPTASYVCLKNSWIKSLANWRILNKKSKFVSKCPHYNKYLIQNKTRNDSMNWCSVLYVCEFYNKFPILFKDTKLKNCISEDCLTAWNSEKYTSDLATTLT